MDGVPQFSHTGQAGEATEATYMEVLARREDDDLLDVSRRLLAWATQRGLRLEWSNVRGVPQFAPVIEAPSGEYCFVEITARGRIDLLLDVLAETAPFQDEAMRLEILRRLNQIGGLSIPGIAAGKRPNFSLNALVSDEAFSQFVETFDWVADRLLQG